MGSFSVEELILIRNRRLIDGVVRSALQYGTMTGEFGLLLAVIWWRQEFIWSTVVNSKELICELFELWILS